MLPESSQEAVGTALVPDSSGNPLPAAGKGKEALGSHLHSSECSREEEGLGTLEGAFCQGEPNAYVCSPGKKLLGRVVITRRAVGLCRDAVEHWPNVSKKTTSRLLRLAEPAQVALAQPELSKSTVIPQTSPCSVAPHAIFSSRHHTRFCFSLFCFSLFTKP